jgi:hypothetical protein
LSLKPSIKLLIFSLPSRPSIFQKLEFRFLRGCQFAPRSGLTDHLLPPAKGLGLRLRKKDKKEKRFCPCQPVIGEGIGLQLRLSLFFRVYCTGQEHSFLAVWKKK